MLSGPQGWPWTVSQGWEASMQSLVETALVGDGLAGVSHPQGLRWLVGTRTPSVSTIYPPTLLSDLCLSPSGQEVGTVKHPPQGSLPMVGPG